MIYRYYHILIIDAKAKTDGQKQRAIEQRGILIKSQLENSTLPRQTTRPLFALLLLLLSALLLLAVRSRLGSLFLSWLSCRLRLGLLRLRLPAAMQSREVDLGNVLVEGLTLGLGDLELEGSGLARAIGTLCMLASW